ncbi:universal stress protein [Spirulina sp. CS-785/01]|uniref:universal stress protein n=1 Tax=Spirulina sp. CS-785/01 TaxID=3021716 RepID=UPI00232CB54E|nr:universal stress protein [Spirulina sp. CS-785/01]MDB9313800.1 universal stress protein [Spirulina sp. CS-785/01]
MFKTVLFPIDLSREARGAMDMVVEIVQKYNSRLVLLSVVEAPEQEQETQAQAPDGMTSVEAVERLLQGAKTMFTEKGIEVEVIEREGMPSFTICDVADELDANLIIMGSSGSGLTQEGVAESVTNRVINLSPCPVLIVP